MEKKIIREGYISELDLFMQQFDKDHPDFGASRLKEIEKHKKIAAKRDGIVGKSKPLIWEKF